MRGFVVFKLSAEVIVAGVLFQKQNIAGKVSGLLICVESVGFWPAISTVVNNISLERDVICWKFF